MSGTLKSTASIFCSYILTVNRKFANKVIKKNWTISRANANIR